MTKKATDPKPATRLDPEPKKTTMTADDAPLHSTDDLDATPPQTTADASPDPASDPDLAPVLVPSPVVPVPDPDPQPEPHYPSGADEIMRRHRLIDPEGAEAKTTAAETEVDAKPAERGSDS